MILIRMLFLACAVSVCLRSAVTAGPPRPDDEVGQTRHRMLSASRSKTFLLSIGIKPHDTESMLICRLTNKGPGDAAVDELFHRLNSFIFIRNGQRNQIGYTANSPNSIIVKEGQDAVWKVSIQQLAEFAGGGNWMPGQTSRIQWQCAYTLSRPLWISCTDPNGVISSHVHGPNSTTVTPILSFVFSEKQPSQLGFLFINGTGEDVAVEKPLTQASRIVAAAPAINYTRDLFIVDQAAEVIEIESGKVGEWRIPWQTVYELIPEEDLEKIKAAAGDLDLVWKVGEYQSDPLPLSLADPDGAGQMTE